MDHIVDATGLKCPEPVMLLHAAVRRADDGDVVVMDRNTFTKVTDTMADAMLPFEPIVDAVSVYRLLGLLMQSPVNH